MKANANLKCQKRRVEKIKRKKTVVEMHWSKLKLAHSDRKATKRVKNTINMALLIPPHILLFNIHIKTYQSLKSHINGEYYVLPKGISE